MPSTGKCLRYAFAQGFIIHGLTLSLIFWLTEAALHTLFFDQGPFLSQVFQPDWNELWMRFVIVAIIIGFSYYAGMVVARLRRSRDELIEERDRAQKYLDVVGVMVLGLDTGGRVSLINRKGCELLGYTEEEIVGRDWFEDFIPEKMRAAMKELFESVVAGEMEAAEYYENPVVARDGVEKLVAWHNAVLRNSRGEVVSSLSSGEDITGRRKAERMLAERLDELERFRKATVQRELRMKELREKLDGILTA